MTEDEKARAEKKRRLREKVFGDVLPDTTRDERGDEPGEESTDEWLKRNVPPHHG
ncbi:MAG TPA: hypothetical protein VFK41_07050 [Nocardioidaceae bacterium]|nr:hypothetical protein [Nocardioidaceae bacterium]